MRALHRVGVGGMIAALTSAFLVVLPVPPAAWAHGASTFPPSRTYSCFVDGLAGGNGGDLNPTNPACANAWQTGDSFAFWNWFGNLLSNAGGRHQEVVPDGNLCGPQDAFARFRQARYVASLSRSRTPASHAAVAWRSSSRRKSASP